MPICAAMNLYLYTNLPEQPGTMWCAACFLDRSLRATSRRCAFRCFKEECSLNAMVRATSEWSWAARGSQRLYGETRIQLHAELILVFGSPRSWALPNP